MTLEKNVLIDGTEYPVTISDEAETLRAAKAAGRVIVGLRLRDGCGEWLPADYIMDLSDVSGYGETICGEGIVKDDIREDDPDDIWLERVVRRSLGLPWEIARTERLIIREFTLADLPQVIQDPEDTGEDRIFQDAGSLEAYIHSQYTFFECGMWALIRQSDGRLVGMAGVVPEEPGETPDEKPDEKPKDTGETAAEEPVYALGYHIYTRYRRRGYAKEACLRILDLVKEEYRGQAVAYVWPDNIPSVSLLKVLGFRFPQKCSGSGKLRYRHAGN